jgi:hypothetical protein
MRSIRFVRLGALALLVGLPLALACAGTRQVRGDAFASGFPSDSSKLKPGGDGRAQRLATVDERVGTRGIEGVTNKWSDVQMAFEDWSERMRLRLAEARAAK